jgi:L-methionine (R)-S-oxide reductase
VVVPDVEARPGHIACDGVTKSEIVVPVKVGGIVVGVLDVDCEGLGAFGEEDRVGLEKFVEAFVKVVDWDL